MKSPSIRTSDVVKPLLAAVCAAVLLAGCVAQAASGRGAVVWSASHEDGTLNDWYRADGGGEFDSGNANAVADTTHAHTGRWAAKLTITAPSESGTRLFRWNESRRDDKATYCAWYYFPEVVRPSTYWNVFQFKSRHPAGNDPFWVVNVGNRSDGTMYLYLYDWQLRRGYQQSVKNITPRVWTKICAYLDQGSNNDGEIEVSQDGKVLWDLAHVDTKYADGNDEWSVNNYSDDVGGTRSIWVDDASITVP
jgi:hypothetical protein